MKDIQALLQQLQPQVRPNFDKSTLQVLFVTPGTSPSWHFDSTYCNHITSDSSIFSSKTRLVISPIAHTADNSIMHVQNIGIVNTPKLSVSNVFHIPTVSLNLLFVSQLCELGVNVHFSSCGCFMQDPQTGEILGTGHKVRRLFELKYLCIPFKAVIVAVTCSILHARLGHPSGCRYIYS